MYNISSGRADNITKAITTGTLRAYCTVRCELVHPNRQHLVIIGLREYEG